MGSPQFTPTVHFYRPGNLDRSRERERSFLSPGSGPSILADAREGEGYAGYARWNLCSYWAWGCMDITAIEFLVLEKARMVLEKLAGHQDQEGAEARALSVGLASFLDGPKRKGSKGTEGLNDAGALAAYAGRANDGEQKQATPGSSLVVMPNPGETVVSVLRVAFQQAEARRKAA